MALPKELISEFVKVTTDTVETKKESTVYGTIVEYDNSKYVKLDGSDLLTPISVTTEAEPNERVTVLIKNHSATVTGNLSSPAVRTETVSNVIDSVSNLDDKITKAETLIATKVDADYVTAQVAVIDKALIDKATIDDLEVERARINDLEAENATITGTLNAHKASIDTLETDVADVRDLTATKANVTDLYATNTEIYNLKTTYGEFKKATVDDLEAIKADIKDLDADKATITDLNATNAEIDKLDANKANVTDLEATNAEIDKLDTNKANVTDLNATNAEIKNLGATYAKIDFANIDFAAVEKIFSESGVIKDLITQNGQITGELVGVTIKGDLIKGNTIVAEKLVVKGEDGLYYKLNTNGVTTSSEQTEYNSLNGSVITAKSITADKVRVTDLVAFGADIGGFHITDHSIFSGAKGGVDADTISGIYLDDSGQLALGDNTRYLKYFKDTDGKTKLQICADSFVFSTSGKTVEETIEEHMPNIEVGARNLIRNSTTLAFVDYRFEGSATAILGTAVLGNLILGE